VTADDGMFVSRFVHFTGLLLVFGVSYFPNYAFSRSELLAAFDIRSRFRTGLLLASFIALASGLSWLVFTAASMADSVSQALSPSTMMAVLGETGFGRVWAIHLALVAALCILTGFNLWGRDSFVISLAALSAACLASLALTGHTQEQEGLAFFVRIASDGAHLLAAGAWLGGLVALLAVLPSEAIFAERSESEMSHILMCRSLDLI
jgi:putative copper resistance protein D